MVSNRSCRFKAAGFPDPALGSHRPESHTLCVPGTWSNHTAFTFPKNDFTSIPPTLASLNVIHFQAVIKYLNAEMLIDKT